MMPPMVPAMMAAVMAAVVASSMVPVMSHKPYSFCFGVPVLPSSIRKDMVKLWGFSLAGFISKTATFQGLTSGAKQVYYD